MHSGQKHTWFSSDDTQRRIDYYAVASEFVEGKVVSVVDTSVDVIMHKRDHYSLLTSFVMRSS